ncbi:MAG TPA: urease accessory protein UreD [Polyangiaceae bacterium]|nr:urease accessory protein UreD [Polyangiaceae bacterium]
MIAPVSSASLDAAAAESQRGRALGWSAELELGFEVVAGRSALVRNRHRGPLAVQRAFYPESKEVAHVYLLHPPGGIVAGDRLTVRVDLAPGARALLTTPAATKFYRSEGRVAAQTQLFRVSGGASLEWLPQETIVFGSAQVQTKTRVELEPGASFCGWDVVCLGRAASGDHFASGRLQQAFEIWQAQRPLWIERSEFDANEPVRNAPWGLGGRRVFGTLVCTGQNAAAVAAARAAVDTDDARELFAVSQLRAAIVCRYLGSSTERARQVFTQAWAALRPLVLGRPASPPRIWLT